MSGFVWLRCYWPPEVEAETAVAWMRVLHSFAGRRPRDAALIEVSATKDGIEHRLRLSLEQAEVVATQLRQVMPGVRLDVMETVPTVRASFSRELVLTTGRRPLATDRIEAVASGLLAAMSQIKGSSAVTLQWWLGRPCQPISVPTKTQLPVSEHPIGRLLATAFGANRELDAEARRALANKQGRPGWRVAGRLAVDAGSSEQLRAVLGALRGAHAPGVSLRSRTIAPRLVTERRVPRRWPLLINVEELTGLAAVPVGDVGPLPILRSTSRSLPADPAVPHAGRIIGRSTYQGGERPLALSYEDSLRHLHVLGPTGVGKSTLLLNLILQDARAGHGVVVIEPKGDLVTAVLERMPKSRHADVVVVDPSDADRPVGINPLAHTNGSPELAVDHLVAVFKGLFGDSWGPRLQDLLTAGLLTLAHHPGATLVMLPQLFTDARLRRSLRGQVRDPVALDPFWSWYENLTEANRAAVLAPLMNKLRAFLLRPSVRGVVGQPQPRLDLHRAIAERRIVLVNLSRGHLGAESANLLGSLVFAGVWQAIRHRAAASTSARGFVGVYVDEFQEYLRLPTDASELLAQSRSLGAGLTLAHQHLDQLDVRLRSAVMANARSRVVFQLGYDDAQSLTRGHRELEPGDLMGLPTFHAYASLSAQGRVRRFASIATAPAPEPSVDVSELRRLSRERYGVPLSEIEASWRPSSAADEDAPVGSVPRRRGRP